MTPRLHIFGTGAHARKVFNCATACGISVVSFVDENPDAQSPIAKIAVCPWVSLPAPAKGDAIFVAIGSAVARKRILDQLSAATWETPVLVHPSSWVAPDALLEPGVFIGAGAVVETATRIGRGTIIDIGALVDHDCFVGPFNHLKAGEVLGPNTKVSSPFGPA